MFKPISSLLDGAIGRLKVRRPVEAALVCRVVDEVTAAYWDHSVAMRASRYRDGVVTIAVTSPAWGQEVLGQGEPIKEAANRRLGAGTISRIRTRVSPAAARGQTPGDDA